VGQPLEAFQVSIGQVGGGQLYINHRFTRHRLINQDFAAEFLNLGDGFLFFGSPAQPETATASDISANIGSAIGFMGFPRSDLACPGGDPAPRPSAL
jgi:hypothetical protein